MNLSKLNLGLYLLWLFSSNMYAQATPSDLGVNDGAVWIEDGIPLPQSDSLFYLEHPAPLFRKEFKTKHPIESASLSITAAGYYKVRVNGSSIEKNVLDPAWTDFSKRIYVSEYDVTPLLKSGRNCLGVSLGNGFYNPLPLRKWGRRNLRNDLNVGKPVFIAKLHIKYKNGAIENIVTDPSWKYAFGPIRKHSVYIGTVYNANATLDGWSNPGFDDATWNQAKTGKPPGGTLIKTFFPPVEITREIIPVNIYETKKETWVVDMGINFTGTYKIKLYEETNDTIVFRFGERVYDDGNVNPMTTVTGQIKKKGVGGPGAPAIAWQTDSYIMGPKKGTWFTPDFTYHTYRFMEIKGLRKKPRIEDIRGLFMHSNVPDTNAFSSSSDLLNAIQSASRRTFISNLISVQSDCPARERFGYGGDINATNESYIYNFNMQSMYRKIIYDWVDAMNDSSFVDTAPYTGVAYCGLSWESAYLTTQYYLYLYYNDTDIIKELYTLNKQWMEKVARIHPIGLVDKGLSDHESLEPVPVQLTGTSHYLQCARIMKTFAEVMGIPEDVNRYDSLAESLKHKIKKAFWDKPYPGKINRQTLFSTLLYHNIIPEEEIPAATDSLLVAVKNGPSGHFNTGIFGTKYALEALSEYHDPNAVFDIVDSREYPGWGYMVDRGATTIWETWKESDNTYSNNHPMFGTVSEWFYRWLAGIRPDPDHPGFKEFFLTPATPEGLNFVNCTYHSPFGPIVSYWEKTTEGYVFELSVPKETIAHVALPTFENSKIELLTESKFNKNNEIKGLETGQFSLPEGLFKIKVTPKKE